MASGLLVASDTPSDRKITLHIDLAGARTLGPRGGRRCSLLIPTQFASTVESRRVLHDAASCILILLL